MSLRPPSRFAAGAQDLLQGAAALELWLYMAWQDIRQRYRRTILGPWWLTISTGLLVLALGLLWSEIFKVETKTFLPFFAIGYVLWAFLSGAINEACTGIVQFEGIVKLRRLPLSALLYRVGVRHLIVLAHNAVILLAILAWAPPAWSPVVLLAVPGLVVLVSTVILALIPVAILCTRYRDLPQIVGNVLQVTFFVTPIMWRPEVLERQRWIAEYNPLAHLLEIVRQPLLGVPPQWQSWAWSGGLLVSSFVLAAYLLGRYGRRVAYWL